MKRFLLVLLVLFLTVSGFAQLNVLENSFMEIEGFENTSPDKQTDDNNQPYAVIIVKLSNITAEQSRELVFEGDARTFIEIEYKPTELWLYVSYYATFLKISHHDLSSTEFRIPFDMGKGKGYMMTLINSASAISDGWGSITIITKPEDGATVKINGTRMKNLTPYKNPRIHSGVYDITVEREFYKPVTKTIELRPDESKTVEFDMPIDYANIRLIAASDAEIVLDDYKLSDGPWAGRLVSGIYEIKCNQPYHKTLTKAIEVRAGEDKEYNLNPQPIMSTAQFDSKPTGATVYVDGHKVGETPYKMDSIATGPHDLTFVKSRYYDATASVVVLKGEPFKINQNLVRNKKTKRFFNSIGRGFSDVYDFLTEDDLDCDNGYVSVDMMVNVWGQPSYGISVGILADSAPFGAYASLNFGGSGYLIGAGTADSVFECSNDLLVDGQYPQYNGEIKNPKLSIQVGFIVPRDRVLSYRIGLGLGFSKVYYMTNEYDNFWRTAYIKNTEYSWGGLEYALGIQLNIYGVLIYTDFIGPISKLGKTDYKALKFGLGYAF